EFIVLPVLPFQATSNPCLRAGPAIGVHLHFYLYFPTTTVDTAGAPHQASLSVPAHSCRICVRHAMVHCLAGELLQWHRASPSLPLSLQDNRNCSLAKGSGLLAARRWRVRTTHRCGGL